MTPSMISFKQSWNKIKKSLPITVSLKDCQFKEDSIMLCLISTPTDKRGQGLASKTLETLLSIAENSGVNIILTAEAMGQGANKALSQDELENWYARKGFVPFPQNPLYWITA